MALDPKDGGVLSRKMWFAVGIAVAMIACWLLTGWWIPLATTYEALLGGLLAVLGLFITGNVANKFVVAKSLANVSFQGEVAGQEAAPKAPAAPAPKKVEPSKQLVEGETEEGG